MAVYQAIRRAINRDVEDGLEPLLSQQPDGEDVGDPATTDEPRDPVSTDEPDSSTAVESQEPASVSPLRNGWVATLAWLLTLSLLANLAQILRLQREPVTPLGSGYHEIALNPIETEATKQTFQVSNLQSILEYGPRYLTPQPLADYANPDFSISGPLWEAINVDVYVVTTRERKPASFEHSRAQEILQREDGGPNQTRMFSSMHCLKDIHRAIREYQEDAVQSLELSRITNCLDTLRADIVCHADDTLVDLAVDDGLGHPRSSSDITRSCHNWKKTKQANRGE